MLAGAFKMRTQGPHDWTSVDRLIGAVCFHDGVAIKSLGQSPIHVLPLHGHDLAARFIDDPVVGLRAAV